jgi:hypothetical protein
VLCGLLLAPGRLRPAFAEFLVQLPRALRAPLGNAERFPPGRDGVFGVRLPDILPPLLRTSP